MLVFAASDKGRHGALGDQRQPGVPARPHRRPRGLRGFRLRLAHRRRRLRRARRGCAAPRNAASTPTWRREVAEPARIDVWRQTEHPLLRARPNQSGRLVLLPGDAGGGEFATGEETLERCIDLLLRSTASSTSPSSTSAPAAATPSTWSSRPPPTPGCATSPSAGWSSTAGPASTSSPPPDSSTPTTASSAAASNAATTRRRFRPPSASCGPPYPTPSRRCGPRARPPRPPGCRPATRRCAGSPPSTGIGDSVVLGVVPLEPILQWREQLITEEDVLSTQIANKETLEALEEIARRLTDDSHWGRP